MHKLNRTESDRIVAVLGSLAQSVSTVCRFSLHVQAARASEMHARVLCS